MFVMFSAGFRPCFLVCHPRYFVFCRGCHMLSLTFQPFHVSHPPFPGSLKNHWLAAGNRNRFIGGNYHIWPIFRPKFQGIPIPEIPWQIGGPRIATQTELSALVMAICKLSAPMPQTSPRRKSGRTVQTEGFFQPQRKNDVGNISASDVFKHAYTKKV